MLHFRYSLIAGFDRNCSMAPQRGAQSAPRDRKNTPRGPQQHPKCPKAGPNRAQALKKSFSGALFGGHLGVCCLLLEGLYFVRFLTPQGADTFGSIWVPCGPQWRQKAFKGDPFGTHNIYLACGRAAFTHTCGSNSRLSWSLPSP